MSVEIIYREKNEQLFLSDWKILIKRCSNVSLSYLPINLEFFLLVAKNNKNFFCDKSFIYKINNQPVACAFLPIEKYKKRLSISLNGGCIKTPLLLTKSLEKKIFKIIDQIALENKVERIMFSVDPLIENNYNFLQKYDYLNTSILSYVIELNKTNNLINACRKGHKCDIKKLLKSKDCKSFFIDKNNASYELHEEYRKLHHLCSGRITRPKETFDLQFKNLTQGNAVLIGLKYKKENIAYAYFEYFGKNAIYASGVDNPSYSGFPIYHLLLFKAMEYLKNKNINYINTEQPSSPSCQFDYYPDQKQFNIALFKRGFSGEFKNYFRGIKYFSKDLFLEDAKHFIQMYSKKYE